MDDTSKQFMDIIDPAFEGAGGIDGDDLLQALSDHEDLMNFQDDDDRHGHVKNHHSSNRSCNSEPMENAFSFDGSHHGNGGGGQFHQDGNNHRGSRTNKDNHSSNRSCASEPFMLDPDFYQLMSAANNNSNSRGGSNNNNNGSTLIGTTIKAPLGDDGGSGRSNKSSSRQSRGRTKRIPRRSKGATSARSRSNSNDANNMMMMTEPNNQAPLFGGGNNNKNSHPENFGNYRDDCDEFNNSMYSTDVSTTYDDAASACSAPADLFEWGMGGNPITAAGGGGNDISEDIDIQKMLMIRGLLDEGCEGDNTNGRNGGNGDNFQPQQIQQRGGRRRHTDGGEFANSLDSKASSSDYSFNNQGSNNRGTKQQQPQRRRKTLDDPLSMMQMLMGGDSEIPTMEQLQMEMDMPIQNTTYPLKRRKSEPMIATGDFWDQAQQQGGGHDEDEEEDEDDEEMMMDGNNQGGQNPMMQSTFLAAAQNAFASINRLKELINGSGGDMESMMNGVQQQQQWQRQGQQGQGQRGRSTQGGPSGGQRRRKNSRDSNASNGTNGYRRKNSRDSVASGRSAASGSSAAFRRTGSRDSYQSYRGVSDYEDDHSMPQGQTPPNKAGRKKKGSKSKSPTQDSTKPAATVSPAVVPQIPVADQPDPELLKLNPTDLMLKLQASMDRTTNTQKALQEWDRANGLPKSHSQTMVNSSRSRKQLTDGVILKKWNGAPLLNFAKEGGAAASRMSATS